MFCYCVITFCFSLFILSTRLTSLFIFDNWWKQLVHNANLTTPWLDETRKCVTFSQYSLVKNSSCCTKTYLIHSVTVINGFCENVDWKQGCFFTLYYYAFWIHGGFVLKLSVFFAWSQPVGKTLLCMSCTVWKQTWRLKILAHARVEHFFKFKLLVAIFESVFSSYNTYSEKQSTSCCFLLWKPGLL